MYHEPGLRLYERLRHVLPGDGWGAFLSNSGAEAVEAVGQARPDRDRPAGHPRLPLRLPRPDRPDDGPDDREGRLSRPLRAAARVASTTRPIRTATARRAAPTPRTRCICDWEAQLDLTFHQFVYPEHVAAVIVEPVLGEGGYLVPPPGFLPRLREITRQHGILLIADEVQTGFGRTGELFAVQHWDVEPDILVMAKGIASGLPLCGIIAQRELMSTSCRPARTAARTAATSSPAPRRTRRSTSSRTRGSSRTPASAAPSSWPGLRALAPKYRSIGDVRGLGLMLALEFVKPGDGDGRVPDPDLTKRIQAEALARKLIVLTAGTYVNVVRIIPPLVTTADEVDLALRIIDESLAAAGA